MQQIRIKGLGPSYDGLYDLDLKRLKNRELTWIKRYSGYLAMNLTEGLGDSELINCFSLIALYRAGKLDPADVPALWEQILDLDFGESGEIVGEPDEEEMPPPPTSSPSKSESSGDDSTTNSETPDSPPNPTGIPASDTSLSVRLWSAS